MTSSLVLHLALGLMFAPAEAPRYVLEITPGNRIATEYTLEYEAPKLEPKEWEFFVAQPPELPGQSAIRITCEPKSETIYTAEPAKRPLQRIRLPISKPKDGQRGVLKVQCEATLAARRLVVSSADSKRPVVSLPAEQRQVFLAPTSTLDYSTAEFQTWVKEQELQRQKDESDVAFGRRVFLALKRDFKYEYVATMDRRATAVCAAGKSDCGGMANVFVATLRSAGVPARTLVGRWAKSANAKEKVGEIDYYQQHVKAEFFADGVGWVPVDVSSAVIHDPTPEGLRYFGNDAGDFLVLHVDGDLEVDTHYFGRKTIPWLQGAAYWVTGAGKLDGATSREGWTVRVIGK